MNDKLLQLREAIDAKDTELLRVLAERFELVNALAEIKQKMDLSVLDPQREFEVLEKAAQKAADLGLPREFVVELFKLIMAQSRQIQSAMRSESA